MLCKEKYRRIIFQDMQPKVPSKQRIKCLFFKYPQQMMKLRRRKYSKALILLNAVHQELFIAMISSLHILKTSVIQEIWQQFIKNNIPSYILRPEVYLMLKYQKEIHSLNQMKNKENKILLPMIQKVNPKKSHLIHSTILKTIKK